MVEAGILGDRQVELLQGETVEMSPEGEPHAYSRLERASHAVVLINQMNEEFASPRLWLALVPENS
ncbi:MAG: hypothetical protein MUF49_07910 [Oculatellaceae cyanobacterium Prado106]|nr:hypothetical protein [Oculatellaceae cyanobacterium Prado106]